MPTPIVDHAEVLYRQLGPGGNPIYFDPDRTPVVHQSLFLPALRDTDGLSLIRSRFRSDIWAAYRKEQSDIRFRLAVLQASQMEQLALGVGFVSFSYGLSADALDVEHGEPWAHCVATQINRGDYDTSSDAKRRIKEWAMQVSRLLTQQSVVGPFNEPTPQDPCRPA